MIRYKRISDIFEISKFQDVLNKVVADGFEIIHYSETKLNNNQIEVTMIIGKNNKF
jgi:hypothetical protein